MKKRNVLFLSSWYPTRLSPTNGDFVERHAHAVSKYCQCSVLHVAIDNSLAEKHEYIFTYNKNVLELLIYIRIPKLFRIFKLLYFIWYYIKGLEHLEKQQGKIEIVHANVISPIGIIAYIFKLFHKLPFIVTEHWTLYLPNKRHLLSKKTLLFSRFFAKEAELITPVTQNLADSMQSLSIKGNYKIVNNVVNTDLFQLGQGFKLKKPFRFLHISTLKDDHKNISGILRTVKALSEIRTDFSLEIIHDQPAIKFKAYVKSLGLENMVNFRGFMNHEELSHFMKECHCLLLFSNYENFPCVIVEAFSAGLPVISSDVGGIKEHVDSSKGILVKTKDETALCGGMNFMIENYSSYSKENMREYAITNFSEQAVGKRFLDIYNEVLA